MCSLQAVLSDVQVNIRNNSSLVSWTGTRGLCNSLNHQCTFMELVKSIFQVQRYRPCHGMRQYLGLFASSQKANIKNAQHINVLSRSCTCSEETEMSSWRV